MNWFSVTLYFIVQGFLIYDVTGIAKELSFLCQYYSCSCLQLLSSGTVTYALLEEHINGRDEWRFSLMIHGALSQILIGLLMMHGLCVV